MSVNALPWMMICAPMSELGLSSTGFMSVCGGTPAACACSACARPISPPSAVTALFNAMFCGLNGATRTPRRRSTRHRPATSVLLPASEVVPCTISAPEMRFWFTAARSFRAPRARRVELLAHLPRAFQETRRVARDEVGVDGEQVAARDRLEPRPFRPGVHVLLRAGFADRTADGLRIRGEHRLDRNGGRKRRQAGEGVSPA